MENGELGIGAEVLCCWRERIIDVVARDILEVSNLGTLANIYEWWEPYLNRAVTVI